MHSQPTPKFSIITVTYNAKATLERTILSVISQTYSNVEYIVVDGASTDGTLEIINKYREHFSTCISEPDNGLYDAMNKGLKKATGDYVYFLNAGDKLHEDDTLQKMAHSIREQEEMPDVLYGETDIVDSQGHFVRKRRLSAPESLTWQSFKYGMLVCHQSFFAKRSLAEPYDLSYRYSSDFDWCIRVMKKSDKLFNTHLTITDYLEEGLTTRNHKASLCERFRIMAKHYGWISTSLMHAWFVVRALIKK